MSQNYLDDNSKLEHNDPNLRSQLPAFYGFPTPEQAEVERRELLKDPDYVAKLRRGMGQRV